MNRPHFEFWNLTASGEPIGKPNKVHTFVGMLMQIHASCDHEQVKHLMEIARETPDYPVDICAWEGPHGDRRMVWSCRIYYRRK